MMALLHFSLSGRARPSLFENSRAGPAVDHTWIAFTETPLVDLKTRTLSAPVLFPLAQYMEGFIFTKFENYVPGTC